MASRSHVDVNERRLRPIYDCLDNGNNKKAITEADKVLKKQKDLTCAKVLKALALLRMGRLSEGSSLLSTIHSSQPTDEQTLSAMAICYKETQQYPLIASLYDAAAKQQPNNEDILSCLFMAHVRLGNYQQQQRAAMMLHKVRPAKNPYYFWAVMSIVMQAHKDPNMGKKMYLPLAEKMTQKYIKDDKIEAEAEILLFLIILELQGKWEEALEVLEGPMGAQLGNELNLRETRMANACTHLQKWDKVNVIYKQLLDVTPDDWQFWLKYLDAGFQMLDCDFTPSDPDESDSESSLRPDFTVELMRRYINEKISGMVKGVLLRGPYLAQLQLIKILKSRKSDSNQIDSVGSSLQLLKEYFEKFGHKFCCFGDMSLFLELLTDSEINELLSHLTSIVGLEEEGKDVQYAKDINQMTRHMVSLQLSRRAGKQAELSHDARIALSQQLLCRYREGLSFGRELLQTDLQYSDNYLLMAVHLLLDAWILTGDDIHVWRAIVHLELGVRESQANFQFKLLLIRLYCIKGVFGPCPALYDGMEIKHIINDTMGYIVSNHVVRLGHMMEAGTMYSTMVRFFLVNQKEASEHLMSSYKYGSFGRIQEFVEFQDRLDNSLQFHSARTEKMLLDLIIQTDCHDAVEGAVECISPQTVPLVTDTLVDNRDLSIALCWDPPQALEPEVYRQKSLEEEKCWLRLRHMQLQLLLAAVELGMEMSGYGGANGNNHEGGDKDSPLERLNSKMKELEESVAESAQFSQPRKYHVIQGPHRTRISTLLSGPHIELLSAMKDCIVYIDSLRKEGIENVKEKSEPCWSMVKEKAEKLIVKDVEGLFKDVSGKRQLDSTALELLVSSVESMSYLTILVGVCNRGLKPLKVEWIKKTKKGNKAPNLPLPVTFENFNNLVQDLSSINKELHQAASALDPVFSSLDITSLRLADLPEEEELQCEAERLVWNKVERSVQQSSREICEVLHHKQFYLNTLML